MIRPLAATLTLIACAACVTQPQARVRITSPEAGAVIASDSLRIVLSASGVAIVAADGIATPGRAHHHVFLDAELSPAAEPIPGGTPGIYHLGKGDSTLVVSGLAPGRHRLIAVLALGNHVPLVPWAVDTVHFTVESAGPVP